MSAAVLFSTASSAQGFDPRAPLGQIIQAFQMCGPPAAYQLLSPQLLSIVAQQTGGRGCYPQISQAGPITGMQVLAQQQFPIGPLFIIRVSHAGGSVDWFVGFNQMTGRIESLTFQPAQQQPPTIPDGPTPSGGGSPSPRPSPSPNPSPGPSGGDGCDLYPAMC
jgi:hypothetical protein